MYKYIKQLNVTYTVGKQYQTQGKNATTATKERPMQLLQIHGPQRFQGPNLTSWSQLTSTKEDCVLVVLRVPIGVCCQFVSLRFGLSKHVRVADLLAD